MTSNDDAPENLTGEEFVKYMNQKHANSKEDNEASGPQMPQASAIAKPKEGMINITHYPSADPKVREKERIEKEKEKKEQEKYALSEQLKRDHPTIVKGAKLGIKILGAAAEKINSAGGRFIEDQNSADRVMRKSSMRVPGTKKIAKRSPSEDDEIENDDEEPRIGGGKNRSNGTSFPYREFDSGSTLPKAAYRPAKQFEREYQSLGVPVTFRQRKQESATPSIIEMGKGSKSPIVAGTTGKIKKSPKIAGISGGEVPMEEHKESNLSYTPPKVPSTLPGGLAMGEFKSLGFPNTALSSGLNIGGSLFAQKKKR